MPRLGVERQDFQPIVGQSKRQCHQTGESHEMVVALPALVVGHYLQHVQTIVVGHRQMEHGVQADIG